LKLEDLSKDQLIELVHRKDQLTKELGADLANLEIAKKEAEINNKNLINKFKKLNTTVEKQNKDLENIKSKLAKK
jgi:hypothetical protein